MPSYAYRAHHAAFVCIHIQCAYICIQTHSYAFMYSVKIRSSLASLVVLSVGQPIFSAMLEVMDPADSHSTLRECALPRAGARYREPSTISACEYDIVLQLRYRGFSRYRDPLVTPPSISHKPTSGNAACTGVCMEVQGYCISLFQILRSDFPVDGEKTTRWHQLPWHVPWSRASMWLRSKAPQRVELPRHGRSWRPPRAPLRAS